jgi:hypothetical protein
VEKKNLEELNFMIEISKKIIEQKYNRNSIIFEHGMCACIGGLDRAHLHIMSIANGSSTSNLIEAVNETLYERKTGIEYIKYKNYKLENLHDINQLFENKEIFKKDDFEIVGEILDIKKIKDLSVKEWPQITFDHINKGGHYVYFKTDTGDSSFLTTHNFQTQFGRQVVFENEMYLSEEFRIKIKKLIDNNPMLEAWKWQSCVFEEGIIETVNNTRKKLKNYNSKFELEYQKYEFKIL